MELYQEPGKGNQKGVFQRRDSRQSDHTPGDGQHSDMALTRPSRRHERPRSVHLLQEDGTLRRRSRASKERSQARRKSQSRERQRSQSPESSRPLDQIEDAISGIARMTFEDYKKNLKNHGVHRRKRRKPVGSRHLIEVVSEHDVNTHDSHKKFTLRQIGWYGTLYENKPASDTTLLVPDRIRINSAQLIDALSEISGLLASVDEPLKSLVMLRPFKFLVTHETDIRKYYEKSKETVAKIHADGMTEEQRDGSEKASSNLKAAQPLRGEPGNHTSSDATVPGSTSAKSPESKSENQDGGHKGDDHQEQEGAKKSKQLLEEFQTLIELLDNDLKPLFNLRQGLLEGSVKDIAFADLWFLLRPGEEVCIEGKPGQIYRVIEVQGGRPDLCTSYELRNASLPSWCPQGGSEYFSDESTTLRVSLYYLKYDGIRLRPCGSVEEVRKYDGLRPIDSLTVYPIKYLKDQSTRDSLVRRGRLFIDLIHSQGGFAHRSFRGVADNLRGSIGDVSP